MSRGALLVRQTTYGLIGFRRNPRAMILVIVMPIVLLALFSSVFGGTTQTTKVGGGSRSRSTPTSPPGSRRTRSC